MYSQCSSVFTAPMELDRKTLAASRRPQREERREEDQMGHASPASPALNWDTMSRFQVAIVALCICIAGLDGFDVLVVAFTAPEIAKEWALNPAALGGLFSAGLAGMGFGALLIAPLGDKLGRRPTVLLCLVILVLGMFGASFARTLGELAALRFFTGLGIGGVLANINIVVAEYSSARRRDLCVALMSVGYPIGATLGGVAAVYLIHVWGWRSVYVFGGLVGLVLIPVTLLQLPESLAFLLARRPSDALDKVNRVLARMDRPKLEALPPAHLLSDAQGQQSVLSIIRSPFLASTLATSFLYFSVMATCYFLLSWTPKVLTDLGFSTSIGISGSLLINIGGTVGCILYGFYANKLGVRRLAVVFMLGLSAMTIVFGLLPADTLVLLVAALALGFFLHTSITVLYVVVPTIFPAAVRATGTGFSMSIGRVGAVTGPLVAGWLMAAGFQRPVYFTALALPMLIAIACLYTLRALDVPEPLLQDGEPVVGAA
jgi:benzoate transport